MKRGFPEADQSIDNNNLALANCLMLLSQGGTKYDAVIGANNNMPNRVFECKTCNRQFPSFQALGGHRASHKKPRLMDGDAAAAENQSPAKPKTHECSICGLEFAIGQALGGHMRRHRAGLSENQSGGHFRSLANEAMMQPIVKKSNSRRVLCLDLNLTPMENDLELFKLGKPAPTIDCFL